MNTAHVSIVQDATEFEHKDSSGTSKKDPSETSKKRDIVLTHSVGFYFCFGWGVPWNLVGFPNNNLYQAKKHDFLVDMFGDFGIPTPTFPIVYSDLAMRLL